MAQRKRLKKIFFVLYLLAIHAFAALFVYERFIKLIALQPISPEVEMVDVNTPIPTPLPVPSIDYASENTNENINLPPIASDGRLMIPVAGIKPEDLQDTFSDSRSEGRVHNSIDIIAPPGAPVVAAADGEIVKFHDSEKGGITIYQIGTDGRTVYYYAHLQNRAENLQEKTFVKQGTKIGYVGDTGNSTPGNYHLHFAIWTVEDPKRFWEGENINPFPLLKNGIESR